MRIARIGWNSYSINEKGEEGQEDSGAGFILAFVIAFLIYITVLMYAQVILGAIVEEKETRIAEILFSSPWPPLLRKNKFRVSNVLRRRGGHGVHQRAGPATGPSNCLREAKRYVIHKLWRFVRAFRVISWIVRLSRKRTIHEITQTTLTRHSSKVGRAALL